MRRPLVGVSATAVIILFLITRAPTSAQQPRRGVPAVKPPAPAAASTVHNAGKLLRETPLVKVHLRASGGADMCTPTVADIVLVFKVDEQYRIANEPSYWSVVDDVVVPAVIAECGGARMIRLENYVDDFRLAAAGAGAPRVYARTERFMTRREQAPGFAATEDGEAVETPLNRAARTVGGGRVLPRSFSGNERNAAAADIVSIADARAEFDRYTAERAVSAAGRQPGAGRSPAPSRGAPTVAPESPSTRENPPPGTVEIGLSETVDAALGIHRRDSIGPVLEAVRGWSPARLRSDVSFLPYAYEDVLGDAFRGNFQPWLGRAPNWPDGLQDRARGWLLDVAVLAYHINYAKQCRSAPGKWVEWTRRTETQSYNRFGPIGPPIVFEKSSIVRAPFLPAFRIRAERQRGGMQDLSSGTALLIVSNTFKGIFERPRGTPNQRWFEQDFKMFIDKAGCTSDATTQLEVNLHLLADGFPPLQELLRGKR
jgi:hypothetical protein